MKKILLAALVLGAGILGARASEASGGVACGANDTLRDYRVHLKDGETLQGRSPLPCREGGAPATRLRIDGRVVYPFQTDSVFEEGVRGVPAPGGAAWAFPIIEGRIRVFAARTGQGMNQAVALSKDSEPLVRYSLKALQDRMRDNPQALNLVGRKRSVGVIGGAMAFGGAAMAFAGIITGMEEVGEYDPVTNQDTRKTEFHPNPLFFAGLALMLGSWFVPEMLTDDNPEKAVRRYNASFAADSAADSAARRTPDEAPAR